MHVSLLCESHALLSVVPLFNFAECFSDLLYMYKMTLLEAAFY